MFETKFRRIASAAAMFLLSAACKENFEGKVPCADDFSCPSGFRCSAGKCVTGNGAAIIAWSAPDGSTPLAGTQTFSAMVSHPDGVSSAKLTGGGQTLKTFTAPDSSFGKSGPTRVDFTGIDTTKMADGAIALTVTATTGLGVSGGDATKTFTIDNTKPTVTGITALPNPAKKNDVVAIHFTASEALSLATVTVGSAAATQTAKTGNAYTFSYTVTGNEPAGTPVAIVITVKDLAGNTGTGNSSVGFLFSAAVPVFTGSNPISPSNSTNTTPMLFGTAGANNTVSIYADNSNCSAAALVATDTAAHFASPGIAVTITINSTHTFYATAKDLAGNVSACSSGFVYVSNTIVPNPPVFTSTSPASPDNTTTTPKILGDETLVAGGLPIAATNLYGDAACTTQLLFNGSPATGTLAQFKSSGIQITVTADSATTVYATATDAAGNVSACSSGTNGSILFVEDRSEATASIVGSTPASPTNTTATTILLFGVSDHGPSVAPTTVYIFANDAACGGVSFPAGNVGFDSGDNFNSTGVSVPLVPNATTTYYALAQDSLGNRSTSCSAGFTFLSDQLEATPVFTTTSPQMSNTLLSFVLQGTADTGANVALTTVQLYADSGCTVAVNGASASAANFASPGITVTVAPNTSQTFWAKATDTAGNTSLCSSTRVLVVNDTGEGNPTISGSNPPSPTNSAATTLKLFGSGADTTLSATTVYIFRNDATCGGGGFPAGNVGSDSGVNFNNAAAGVTVPLVPNQTSLYYTKALDAAGNASACSAAFSFSDFQSVANAVITAPTISNAWTSTVPLTGTADPTHPSTVYIYSGDATCGGINFPAGAAAFGGSSLFTTAGIPAGYVTNGTTSFFAKARDAEGNNSPACSGPFNMVSNRSSFCASASVAPAQIFSSNVQGCSGTAAFANRATLCAPGCRVASADEYVVNQGGLLPTHNYWTDDALRFSSASGSCGAGCGPNNCFASMGSTYTSPCAATRPMRVCAATQPDPETNTCTWTGCGYNSIAPNESFGGCSGLKDGQAGALCICGVQTWFVSSSTGADTNDGSSGAPFKTITKGLSVAVAGQVVHVLPGTYDAPNGETFPLSIPTRVSLIGDEAHAGNGPTATKILGTVKPISSSTLAGFVITSSGIGVDLTGNGGVTIRNNTITNNPLWGILVNSSTNQTIVLNSSTNNARGILYQASTAGGKVENNTFTGNAYGIEFDAPGSDIGGGPAGSVGNNVLSCNTNQDVWAGLGAATLGNNKWDHVPPTSSGTVTPAGLDLYFAGFPATQTSANGGAGLSPTPCLCAPNATSAQVFDSVMTGCRAPGTPASIAYANRANLCPGGCHACTATDWLNHHGSTAPNTNYWTGDNPLNFIGGATNSCDVSTTAGTNVCTGGAMLVCPTLSGANHCQIWNCGLDTTTPPSPQFFGGCAQSGGGFGVAEGTLCCCP
jgi:parallel beta-helix repeat protein